MAKSRDKKPKQEVQNQRRLEKIQKEQERKRLRKAMRRSG